MMRFDVACGNSILTCYTGTKFRNKIQLYEICI